MSGAARAEGDTVRVLAPAKINLALRVLAGEASGYHQIETLFCRLELADEIEARRTAGDVTLDVVTPPESAGAPPDLGPTEDNLAVRAVRLFLDRTGIPGGVALRLVKRIPPGAGLGGGSSDAAAALRAVNGLCGRPLEMADLITLAGELGSDVPFFAAGAALALGWARGNRLLVLPPLPSRPVVLAVPPFGSSTAAAYRALAAARSPGHVAAAAVIVPPRSWRDVVASAGNEFEDVVFAAHPRLAEVRSALGGDARLSQLTGTGSVVFGIFEEARDAEHAAQRLKAAFPEIRSILTRTAEMASVETQPSRG